MQATESEYHFASNDLKLHGNSEQFLNSLVQTVQIFSNEIGMSFVEEPCTI